MVVVRKCGPALLMRFGGAVQDDLTTIEVIGRCVRSPRFWAMAFLNLTLGILSDTQSYLTLYLTGVS
jgi:hypothetical protein